VNPEQRLVEIVNQLQQAGMRCLVMGGHAARFYGFLRHTKDFDLHLAPESWDGLAQRVRSLPLFAAESPEEGPSWRPADFRRFRIGRLPGGQEEWLEFWRANHLLAPFDELYARREEGEYGGTTLPFLSLFDLICSKETEREKDWDDIEVLEELHNQRLVREVNEGRHSLSDALALLRCRRGVESFARIGQLASAEVVREAIAKSTLAITQALLLPYAPDSELPDASVRIEPVVLSRLRSVDPGSRLYFALVEIVRRQHRKAREAADKLDKERIRAESQGNSPRS
jgi:hypothetical protein